MVSALPSVYKSDTGRVTRPLWALVPHLWNGAEDSPPSWHLRGSTRGPHGEA